MMKDPTTADTRGIHFEIVLRKKQPEIRVKYETNVDVSNPVATVNN
jgi:hypothetical protein